MDIREVSKIWISKVDLLYYTSLLFPSVNWYIWVDAGLNEYREKPAPKEPWPGKNLDKLYPAGKFVYSQTRTIDDCLPANYKIMGGAVFMVHRSVIFEIHALFYATFHRCMDSIVNSDMDRKQLICCTDDQIIFHRMKLIRPDLFYENPSKGDWGAIIKYNY